MKLALATLALAACGTTPTTTSVRLVASDAPPRYGDTPFPTDALRDGTHLAVIDGLDGFVGRHAELVAAHIAALDGFGLRPLVELFLDGPLDASTVAGDAVGLVDVDPASPERGRAIAMDWRYDADRGVLAGSPASGAILREGTRYAAFATTALRDPGGAHLAPADLAPLAGLARWQSTVEAAATLDLGDALAGIAAFTTEHATAPLLAARAQLATAPAPTLAFDDSTIIFSGPVALARLMGTAPRFTDGPRAGTEHWGNGNATGLAHDHVGVVATGTMTVARFRRGDTGTNAPDDETFADPPALVAIDPIPVTFILPAAPAPATGYPVIIYGHGLGAGRDALLSFAEPLTAAGFAVVGIDMFGHGSRYNPVDNTNNLAGYMTGFTGDPHLHDGFGDITGLGTTFDFFEGFLDVAAVRDSIRQSALDLSRLVQLLRAHPDLSAIGGALDTSHIAYLGESFGSVVGTVFAAIDPTIDLFVLDVPGGGILDKLLPDSAEIGSLALPVIQSIYLPVMPLDRWNPLIGLMQAVIDGADPLSYAPHVLADRFPDVPPRSVVLLEVVGDQVLSNVGTEALARELGLDVLAPGFGLDGLANVASPATGNRGGQTAVLVQYAPATHGANWSNEHGTLSFVPGPPVAGPDPFVRLPAPITIANPLYETWEQVIDTALTHQAGLPPRVRSTKAPVHDFDGDGVPDDVDPFPYDPAH